MAKTKAEAARSGVAQNDLLQRFFHQCLLARVFHRSGDDWILKVGQALLVRWPRARHSRDIDLLHTDDDMSEAVRDLQAAAGTDLGDPLRYEFRDTKREQADRPACKVRFAVYLGVKELATVSVDVVVSKGSPYGEPAEEALRPPVDIDLSAPWPQVRMWPLEDHVADKVAAMYERHAGDAVSSRYKDLVDVALIALASRLDGPATHGALHAEVQRRHSAGVPLHLPAQFTVPDLSTWRPGYRRQAVRATDLPEQYRTIDGVHSLADHFITPLLNPAVVPGTWVPDTVRWHAR
ncbi:nucleotidyl transferase AbiEii/AbiGii toxin family protein [Prauserella halophila]|nr:nucleotidyl transferase AbiEii/AbiGii toxin family protein [Prauserella halophila]MCP2235276.1 Nucleotidyl transferase AbiEii toxin, Type IV TA system [Prauserella halophila]